MRVSIVIPVYNEAESIAAVVRACDDVLAAEHLDGEIVVADDGSTDGTSVRLRNLETDIPRLRIVSLRVNQGQTHALAAAIARATGDVIVSLDGDGQNDPRDIPLLLTTLAEGYDVVSGWRRERRDRWLTRTLPSRAANALIALVTRVPVHDNGCGLKAYRASVLRAMPLYSDMHRFLPGFCAARGARIGEVPVRHHPRNFGQSKYGLTRIWSVLLDIVTLKMLMTFSSRPAAWFGACAVPWFGLGVVCIVAALFADWLGTGLLVLPTLGFLFTYLGLHLVVMGLLGEAFVAQHHRRDGGRALPLAEEV